jgi:hypothetical protein
MNLKMKHKKYFLPFIVITFLFKLGWAQNSVSVTDHGSILIDMSAIIAAGMKTEMVADSTQWLNYSLDVNRNEPFGTISVEIASGNIPSGMEIYLQAGNYNGSYHGKTGRPVGKIKVDHMPMVLINDIGTSNTGNGKHKGHQLFLSVVITDYALLQPGDNTLYFLYTLKQ